MIEVIIWLVMSIITQVTKKTAVDAKIIILALSVIVWVAFYFIKFYYPNIVDVVRQHTLGAYWISQVIYNYWFQLWEERKEKKGGETKKK